MAETAEMACCCEDRQSCDALNNVLNDRPLVDSINNSKVLLVGGGGIGCEVIKNLLLTGFSNVVLIDLDTIDVSNLNRQFLFNKSHVGQSKAKIAATVAVNNFSSKEVNVKPIHNSIQSQDFDVEFFKSFTFVINALDNKAARSHVNRMCLAANVPLLESGSEGYFGQVFTIQKSISACYECDGQKQDQRTFASCTIRNTPSLPIHCIVWGKHLFSQLFGEEDADNDVSPDLSDSEIGAQVEQLKEANETKQPSTREWARSNDYDPKILLNKLFFDDIQYLLKMDKLWEKRRKPTPLKYEDLDKEYLNCQPSSSTDKRSNGLSNIPLKDQRLWSIKECYEVFAECLEVLKSRILKEKILIWDKDDEVALNFVTSVSNLRSHCFGIEMKSKFDVKSLAGNIIPAISSTNSIVGGLITLQALKILKLLNAEKNTSKEEKEENEQTFKTTLKHIYLRKVSLTARNLLSSYDLFEPNPNCLVCSGNVPEIEVTVSLKEVLMNDFVEQVLFKKLNFVCPDVLLEGTPVVLWSKDDNDELTEGEKEEFRKRLMSDYKSLKNNTRLKINDLLQDYSVIITLKDEKVDINENDGIFYKINVGELKAETKVTESDENKVPAKENNGGISLEEVPAKSVEVDSSSLDGGETSEENVIVIEDDEDDSGDVVVMAEFDNSSIREVANGDETENENSVDIIEVTEKRSADNPLQSEGFLSKKRRLA